MKKILKKILYYILLPFVLLWFGLAWVIFNLGDWIRTAGNWMSGWKFDDSIGSVYIK